MSDERKLLYDNYVSGFKDFINSKQRISLKTTRKYNKAKLLPYLREFNFDAKVLELGCGPGLTLEYLRDIGFKRLKGIDISTQQIEKASQKDLDVEVRDVFEFLTSSKQKYDIIIAFDFIEHFKKTEIQQLFNVISNCLESNGMLIIRTPNGQGLFPGKIIYGDLTHYTIFNPNSLLQILKINGFDRINFIESGPVAKNLKGAVRLVLWKTIKLIYHIVRIVEQGTTESIITREFYCFARKK
jgi:predicted TPR repeat methyltransferase